MFYYKLIDKDTQVYIYATELPLKNSCVASCVTRKAIVNLCKINLFRYEVMKKWEGVKSL